MVVVGVFLGLIFFWVGGSGNLLTGGCVPPPRFSSNDCLRPNKPSPFWRG